MGLWGFGLAALLQQCDRATIHSFPHTLKNERLLTTASTPNPVNFPKIFWEKMDEPEGVNFW